MHTPMEQSCNFTFGGKHCDDFGVCFLPSSWAFLAGMSVPTAAPSGRHGTVRYPGRTYKAHPIKGALYLLSSRGGTRAISGAEMLTRASEIAAWLNATDARQKLVLDALPDRYLWADVTAEAALTQSAWANGTANITFDCQPFYRALVEDSVTGTATAPSALRVTLPVRGNAQTLCACDVKNTGSATITTLTLAAADTRFVFSALALAPGETLSASYDVLAGGEGEILSLYITGTSGAVRSAMGARTGASDDDILLLPGRNTLRLSANGTVAYTLRARGRYY